MLKWLKRNLVKLLIWRMSPRELFDLAGSARVLKPGDSARIKATLTFGRKTVAEIMVPADQVKTVLSSETFGPVVLHGLHQTGHRRFPVVNKDFSRILGILYLDDLEVHGAEFKKVKEAMRAEILYVSGNEHLDHALSRFLHSPSSLFIVKNEQNRPVGVISLEDVLASLLGRNIERKL